MTELNYILFYISFIGLGLLFVFPLFSFLKYKFTKSIPKKLNHSEPVSIILTCYNEENYIKQRIVYFLDPNEWIENSEIIVISTGSTDRTDKILHEFKDDFRVKILILENRLSKIKTLNRFVNECKNDIIVFSDCRQIIEKNAVKNLVRHFSDLTINVVSSTLKDTKNKDRISVFRQLLNRIAIWESKTGSSLNLFGALYAQRKSAFRHFPESLLFDDLYVVVSTLKQNKRLIQDSDVVIKDVDFNHYYQKDRIERLVRGLLIFLHSEKKLIFSLRKKDLLRFLHFKYLKLLMPFFLLIGCLEFFYFYSENSIVLTSVLIVGLFTFILPSLRKIVSQFIKINHYFATSILKFYWKKERNNSWKPLNVSETNNQFPK